MNLIPPLIKKKFLDEELRMCNINNKNPYITLKKVSEKPILNEQIIAD